MTLTAWEAAARQFEAPARRWETPGQLALALDPRTKQTPALDLIDAALVELFDTPDGRLIISMPPQEGKSTRVAKDFPTWVLTQNPDTRIVTASYGQSLANRNGRAIRRNVTDHNLGLTLAPDNGAVHEWQIGTCPDCWVGESEPPGGRHKPGHDGGVLSVGIGAGVTGRPADMLVIDDPIKDRKEAESEVYRQANWDWWTDSGSPRLAPGAPVVLILTRWHEDDLAGRLLKAEDGHTWRVINIPALADHDPNRGQVDPLGREPGEFMVSARGRSRKQWEAVKARSSARTWNSLFQGRPSPPSGDMFLREWWREYAEPKWIVRDDGSHWVIGADEVCMSWDMAFKDLDSSDYVVGQVWARYGLQLFLVDQIRDRMSFVETRKAVRTLAAKWPQAIAKYIEDKANGTAVMNSLSRTVAGMIPVEPDGSKFARASAVTPFVEAHQIYLPAPELAPWVGDFIEEHASFPNGAHDDQVDGTSQAINRMLLAPLLDGSDVIEDEDLDDELASYEISRY